MHLILSTERGYILIYETSHAQVAAESKGTSTKGSFGSEILLSKKSDELAIGGNQDWHSMRDAVLRHAKCSSERNGGRVCYSALHYEQGRGKVEACNYRLNIYI